ncbi:pitrilysin family protein [Candidatus Amarobacter glycogenicus]|uniref:M16 family metallopeptidase n=1 Tax=Candidatus Amarobacter glycogenicus TaxID=3140699 RepID=UPI0031365FCF|nr:insulinase family protein [Dehalococcoidia bacterium]
MPPVLPFPALETTLPNGLRIIALNTGYPNLVSLQIPVQTGSRNEVESGKSGFAHFFEHMMFRGTERFPAEAYQEVITRAGARQNAYTTDDYTNYHITFAKEDLDRILELEADRFMNLRYSESDFKTEARAILGEYNKSAADPLTKLFEVQRQHAYTTHTYKHTTMGFIADIEDMPNQFEYSRTFFERWYRPEYATVIIAGDIDPEAATAMVEKHWSSWRPGSGTPVPVPPEPAQSAPVVVHHRWDSPTLPWVTIGFHGPAFSATEKEYVALDFVFDLLFGETSDLYRRLVEREQVVDQLFPYLPASQDPGLATIMARVKRPEDTVYVRDAIAQTLAQAVFRPIPAKRLDDAKSHARYSFVRTLDNSESIASTLARFVRFERRYDTLNELFETSDTCTPDELLAVAKRYLRPDNMVVATLSHDSLPAAVATPPSLAPPGAAALTTLKTISLPSPSPLVRFKLLFTTGSSDDPAAKHGLAALAASMITEAGSSELPFDEITRALFPLAASFSAQVDRDMTTFTGVAHRDTLDRFLEIALPQLLSPGFREEDFSRLKAQHLNELTQDLRSNNEEELGKERLQELLFAGTPYGHTTLGSISGLTAITLDDVRQFVSRHYTRANLVLGITGDIAPAAGDALKQALGALPEGKPRLAYPVTGNQPQGLRVEVIEKDTRSVGVSIGHPIAIRRGHPDFVALWLARAWLGEHRASNGRLYNRIREVRGMNYGDYAYIEAFPRGMYQFFPDPNLGRRAQLFELWLRPLRPEQAVFGLKLALFELRKMVEIGIPTEEFEATREYLAKNVFVLTKTQDQQLGYALDSDWYGIPEYTGYIREELAKLTAERVNEVIRAHISPDNLQIVMISANAAALRDQLLSSVPATIAYDGEKAGPLLVEDREVGAYPLGLAPEHIRITPLDAVFA